MDPEHRRTAELDSARIRALAHPLRTRLLTVLRREGPATATALAQRLGTNSGQTSYHLRQLADVGLVEEDPERGTGRDRWWRSVHQGTTWSSVQFRADPDDRAADAFLVGNIARTHARWTQDWLEARDEWSDDWVGAAELSDFRLRLTPDRARALTEELHAIIERYRAEGTAPDGEWYTLMIHAFPQPETSA